jgi:hypothetical protein
MAIFRVFPRNPLHKQTTQTGKSKGRVQSENSKEADIGQVSTIIPARKKKKEGKRKKKEERRKKEGKKEKEL